MNPGFELDANNDTRPDSWTNSSKFTRSSTKVFRGSYAGKLAATDNSGVTIRQTVRNLTAGARYTFSGQVNIPTSSDTFTLKLQVVWRTGDTVLGTSTIKTYTASTSGWNLATASFNAPTGTTNAQVQIVASSLNRTIYLDEFLFRR
jgi:hypothetical protein